MNKIMSDWAKGCEGNNRKGVEGLGKHTLDGPFGRGDI